MNKTIKIKDLKPGTIFYWDFTNICIILTTEKIHKDLYKTFCLDKHNKIRSMLNGGLTTFQIPEK